MCIGIYVHTHMTYSGRETFWDRKSPIESKEQEMGWERPWPKFTIPLDSWNPPFLNNNYTVIQKVFLKWSSIHNCWYAQTGDQRYVLGLTGKKYHSTNTSLQCASSCCQLRVTLVPWHRRKHFQKRALWEMLALSAFEWKSLSFALFIGLVKYTLDLNLGFLKSKIPGCSAKK